MNSPTSKLENEETPIELLAQEIRRSLILVIEKNAALGRALKRSLKEAGAGQVINAGTAKEAQQILKQEKDIKVIICCDELDDCNALEFMTALSRSKKFRDIALLFTSKNRSPEMEEQVKKLGLDGYLSKPFALDSLRDNVQDAFEVREKKIQMRDARLITDIMSFVQINGKDYLGRCIELSEKECILVTEVKCPIGTRIQFQLTSVQSMDRWNAPLMGSISSVRKVAEEEYSALVVYATAPKAVHGISEWLQHFMDKQPS